MPIRTAALALLVLFAFSVSATTWDYRQWPDSMTGRMDVRATLGSENSLSLPFPYSGKNKGLLSVRQHPKYGLDVFVSIEKGQTMCSSYRGCTIQIRFDEGQPIEFSGRPPADNSTNVVFLNGRQRFISYARKASTIRVQLTVFQAGDQTIEFVATDPLMWPVTFDASGELVIPRTTNGAKTGQRTMLEKRGFKFVSRRVISNGNVENILGYRYIDFYRGRIVQRKAIEYLSVQGNQFTLRSIELKCDGLPMSRSVWTEEYDNLWKLQGARVENALEWGKAEADSEYGKIVIAACR